MRMVETEMPTVWTIGHSTRTWKDFLCSSTGIPGEARRRRVVSPDRDTTLSSTGRPCRQNCGRERIGYVHLQKLGGLRHARRESPNMGWRNTSFRGFADYMQTSEFEAGLNGLMKLAGQKRSAIMCAEAVPWRCHRSLIADALTIRGIRVDDIISMKNSQVHSLIPFACVQRHRITYPVGRSRRRATQRTKRKQQRRVDSLLLLFVHEDGGKAAGSAVDRVLRNAI